MSQHAFGLSRWGKSLPDRKFPLGVGIFCTACVVILTPHTRNRIRPNHDRRHHPGPTKARWGSGLQKWVTDRLITRIVDSLQIHVRDVHVRYEVCMKRGPCCCCLSRDAPVPRGRHVLPRASVSMFLPVAPSTESLGPPAPSKPSFA